MPKERPPIPDRSSLGPYGDEEPVRERASDLIERLSDDADLCRNDGADDIADLLDEAREALSVPTVQSGEDQVEAVAEVLVDMIEEAGDGYSIRLTRLVDDEAEYTLCYDGQETLHQSHDEAVGYFQDVVRKEKIGIAASHIAAIAAMRPTPDHSALLMEMVEALRNTEVELDRIIHTKAVDFIALNKLVVSNRAALRKAREVLE